MAKLMVNVHEAKTQLSRLIERALAGDEVVIARAGVPAVMLSPAPAVAVPNERLLGLLKGQIWTSPDFDQDDPELERLFLGEGPEKGDAAPKR